MKIDYEDVRRLTITALFSDDLLLEQVVLKGGNAMSLVHKISPRFSLDLDFSIEADFEDVGETQARIEMALISRFSTVGVIPFDIKLLPKPAVQKDPKSNWGGYQLQFKLTDEASYKSYFVSDLTRLRREAALVGPNQQKIFTVDFSKGEYTSGKVRTEFDAYTIYVYPLAMIAVEKVRALCQQMKEYPLTGKNKSARARDFLDIYTIANNGFSFSSDQSRSLFEPIFAAKEVPLSLIANLPREREFHRLDWISVEETMPKGALKDFDFYFDFLISQLDALHSLWKI